MKTTNRKCNSTTTRFCKICCKDFRIEAMTDDETCNKCSALVEQIPYRDPEEAEIINSYKTGSSWSTGGRTPAYIYED